MGDNRLPSGWSYVEIGSVLDYEQPTRYIVESTEYDDSYPTPVLTAGKSFIIGYTNEENGIFSNLPVIIFDDFTTSSQYVDFKFKVKSSAMKILSVKNNIASPKYLYYLMQTINFQHVTHKRYWISEYSKIKIPLAPLAEQYRIVIEIEELLSELDEGVIELQKVKAQLKVYRQAVLKDAFSSYKNLRLVTEYFDVTGGLTKNSRRNEYSIKMPYLRVANVYYNLLDLTEIKEIGVNESEIERTLLKVNDLLFVEGNGSKDQIGRVALWNGEVNNCLHQNHIIKARPNGKMASKFALYYLISEAGRSQIQKVASSTAGLYTLSISKVENLKVPDCTAEQQKQVIYDIESRLSLCEKIEKTIDTTLELANSLKKSILKKAFEGNLAVNFADDRLAKINCE